MDLIIMDAGMAHAGNKMSLAYMQRIFATHEDYKACLRVPPGLRLRSHTHAERERNTATHRKTHKNKNGKIWPTGTVGGYSYGRNTRPVRHAIRGMTCDICVGAYECRWRRVHTPRLNAMYMTSSFLCVEGDVLAFTRLTLRGLAP